MDVLLIYCDVAAPSRASRFLDIGVYHQVLLEAGVKVGSHLFRTDASVEQLSAAVQEKQPRLIAWFLDEFNWDRSAVAARALRSAVPDTPFIAFGIFPVLDPEAVSASDLFRYIVIGEGEFALYELASQVLSQGDLAGIKNLWWKDGATWNRNPLRPLQDNLDQFPYANRSLFEQLPSASPPGARPLSVSASRGCMYDCQFCYSPLLKRAYGGKGNYYRARSPQHLVGEINALFHQHGYTRLVFVDEQFPLDKQWLRTLGQRLQSAGQVTFQATVSIERCDDECLELLQAAGCSRIVVGVETGNENFRKRIADRNQGNDRLLEFAAKVRARGMALITTSLAGLPLESEELLHETYTLNQQLGAGEVRTRSYVPIAGTPLQGYAKDKGYLPEAKPDGIPSFEKPNLQLPELGADKLKAHLLRMHFLDLVQRLNGVHRPEGATNLLHELGRAKLKLAQPSDLQIGLVVGGAGTVPYMCLAAGAEVRFHVPFTPGTAIAFGLFLPPSAVAHLSSHADSIGLEIFWSTATGEQLLFSWFFGEPFNRYTDDWTSCLVPAPSQSTQGELKLRVTACRNAGGALYLLNPTIVDLSAPPEIFSGAASPEVLRKISELEAKLQEAEQRRVEAEAAREQKIRRIAELQGQIIDLEKELEQRPAPEEKAAGVTDKLRGMFRK